MKNLLLNYAWEIMDLGAANGVDNSVARDMFVENLSTYGTDAFPNYPGADVDYAALSKEWNALSDAEQGNEKVACKQFMTDKYDELAAARRANDKGIFYEILLNYEVTSSSKPTYYLYEKAWDCWDKADELGVDLIAGKDALMAEDTTWATFSTERKTLENDWYAAKVVTYDQGLKYARTTGNRALFEAVLATR